MASPICCCCERRRRRGSRRRRDSRRGDGVRARVTLRLRAGADGRRSRGGKLGRAAQRELDGARAGPKRCPGDDAARGSRSAVRRFSKERLGPAPEPEAAL